MATLRYLNMPVFLLNSVHDYWQVMCILTAMPEAGGSSETCSHTPTWTECAPAGNSHLSECSPTQIDTINSYVHRAQH